MPFWRRTASPSAETGPFAPSATIFAFHPARVRARDHVLEGRRDEHVAFRIEDVLGRKVLRAGKAGNLLRRGPVLDHGLHVEALRVDDRSFPLGEGDDRRAAFLEELRGW